MYKEMYLTMFRAAKDALLAMEQQNYGIAKATLMCAQFECESLYTAEDLTKTATQTTDFVENDTE